MRSALRYHEREHKDHFSLIETDRNGFQLAFEKYMYQKDQKGEKEGCRSVLIIFSSVNSLLRDRYDLTSGSRGQVSSRNRAR